MVEWKDLTKREKETIEQVAATQAGKRMLDRKCPTVGTKLKYSQAALLFSQFMGKGIDDAVNEYVSDVKANMYQAADKWEESFKDFTIWLKEHGSKVPNKKLKGSSIGVYFAGAMALINSNVPRSMRLQAEYPEYTSRTIAGVTIEDLKEIYNMCDERERAFIGILKDSGISADDALRLNYGDVKGFEKDNFVHMPMYRGKEAVEYETFIGLNAVEALRGYTTIRRNRGEVITDETPIFASNKEPYGRLDSDGLFVLFWRIKQKTRKTISTHRLRKFFETYMALTVRHPIVLKYWMGHKIKGKGGDIEARYIIPPTKEQLELYKQAYKSIDLTQAGLEERVKAVEKLMETLTPEQRETMTRYGIKMGSKRKTATNGGQACEDGMHCDEAFEQVSESDLLGYLRQGYSIVHRLQSGEVIVKR